MREAFDRVAEGVLAALMAAMCVLVFVGVFFRYVLLEPISWTEEVGRFCLVWVSFIGTYLAHRRSQHIAVTVLVDHLAPARQRHVRIAVSALLAAFMVMLMVQGTAYTTAFVSYYSPILELPLGMVYAALPVAATLILIAIVLDIGKELRPNRDPGERP